MSQANPKATPAPGSYPSAYATDWAYQELSVTGSSKPGPTEKPTTTTSGETASTSSTAVATTSKSKAGKGQVVNVLLGFGSCLVGLWMSFQ